MIAWLAAIYTLAVSGISLALVINHYIGQEIANLENFLELLNDHKQDGLYDECISAADRFLEFPNSVQNGHGRVLTARAQCLQRQQAEQRQQEAAQIDQAWPELMQIVNNGELERAIVRMDALAPNRHHQTFTEYRDRLCEQIAGLAQREYWQDSPRYLNDATYLANAVSQYCSSYSSVIQLKGRWSLEFETNQRLLEAADQALRGRNPNAAADALARISDHPYWQTQARPYLAYQRAVEYLQTREFQNAIAHAQGLPDEYPWHDRKVQLISEATSQVRSRTLCERVTFGAWPGCYD
jgi:hypothetical protein